MAANRFSQRRRTSRQVHSDERAARLATFLGRALRTGRGRMTAKQSDVAAVAGISQSCWSELERGHGGNMSLRVWMRAADAVGSDLRAYLEALPGAEAPRDAVHLGIQELVASTAASGGWRAATEQLTGRAGFADLVLSRGDERALVEVWTWLADVGDAFRSWERKLERLADIGGSAMTGCWVLRATRRNRELVAAHRTLFDSQFPASSEAWRAALTDAGAPAPRSAGLLWVTVRGDRLYASRARAARR